MDKKEAARQRAAQLRKKEKESGKVSVKLYLSQDSHAKLCRIRDGFKFKNIQEAVEALIDRAGV